MQQYVIIVAGGTGSRMKSDRPKQFLELSGIPVIIRTIRCFITYNPGIGVIVVVHSDYRTYLEELLAGHELLHTGIQITTGGASRFESVRNGLSLIGDVPGVVGIHDAARPLVSLQTIAACYDMAAAEGSAIPCVAVHESLRKASHAINHAVDRNEYRIVQTPQCFSIPRIKAAFRQEYSPLFTDDATVFESAGETVVLVEGNEENIKITSPRDLLIANALLQS